MVKMTFFEVQYSTKLISRKIWIKGKILKFFYSYKDMYLWNDWFWFLGLVNDSSRNNLRIFWHSDFTGNQFFSSEFR